MTEEIEIPLASTDKYEEALAKARFEYEKNPCASEGEKKLLEIIFPELRESEVEKAAYDYALRVDMGTCGELVVPAFIAGAKWQERQKEQKPAECVPDSVKFDEGFKTGREIGFREGAESVKPVEWSDDFEENIRILLHDKLTWHSDDGKMSSAVLIDDKTLKDIISGIWFYVGKEALKYPNKELSQPEWSEEDERILKGIIGLVDHDQHYGVANNEMLAWLKSLRPQPKQEWNWDDEDFEKFRSVLAKKAFLDEITSVRVAKELLGFLKHYRPQPHWKPSEKQMDALYTAAREAPIVKESGNYLYDLYDDLKKL